MVGNILILTPICINDCVIINVRQPKSIILTLLSVVSSIFFITTKHNTIKINIINIKIDIPIKFVKISNISDSTDSWIDIIAKISDLKLVEKNF